VGALHKITEKQGATDVLRHRILTGVYAAGDSLPGERELSEELGISRLTLRSAIAHLESEGLLRAVHGSGTRVLAYRETGGVDLLSHLGQLALSGQIPGGLDVFAGLLELRRAVAIDAVALAAERASEEELRAMRDHIAKQKTLLGDPRAFMLADLGFARLIVRATRNLSFELLFNSVVRTATNTAGLELAFIANARTTLAIYERLLDRMERRDSARARATAERLLHRLDRSTIDAIALFLGSPSGSEPAKSEPMAEPAKKKLTTKMAKKTSPKRRRR
jgi:DNA-binding FadR family transcriptional regulator